MKEIEVVLRGIAPNFVGAIKVLFMRCFVEVVLVLSPDFLKSACFVIVRQFLVIYGIGVDGGGFREGGNVGGEGFATKGDTVGNMVEAQGVFVVVFDALDGMSAAGVSHDCVNACDARSTHALVNALLAVRRWWVAVRPVVEDIAKSAA